MSPKIFFFTHLYLITPPYTSLLSIHILLFHPMPLYAYFCLFISIHNFFILSIPNNAYSCVFMPIWAPLCIFRWLHNNSTIALNKNIARQSPCTAIFLQSCPFKVCSWLPIKCVINKNSTCSA